MSNQEGLPYEVLDSIECLHTIEIEEEKYDQDFNSLPQMY